MSKISEDRGHTPIVVYFNGTFMNRQNGAHTRMFDQLTWLCANFSDVTLYSYSNHPDWPWGPTEQAKFRKAFPNVTLVLEHRPRLLKMATRIKNALLMLAPQQFRKIVHWRLKGSSPLYEKLSQGNPVLFVNYVDALTELNGIDSSRIVVETHDLKFLNFAKRHLLPITNMRVIGRFRNEMTLLNHASALIAISPNEAALFKTLVSQKPVFYVPSYGTFVNTLTEKIEAASYDLIFVGSENTLNVTGIIDFLKNSHWANRYRLAIAGRICQSAEVARLVAARVNIDMLGYVDDLGPVYAKTKVAISPVDGTGMKVKVLDALAAGVPVLGSGHTIDGLPPGSENCVFPLTEAHARELLDDAANLDAARKAASSFSQAVADLGDVSLLANHIGSMAAMSCESRLDKLRDHALKRGRKTAA